MMTQKPMNPRERAEEPELDRALKDALQALAKDRKPAAHPSDFTQRLLLIPDEHPQSARRPSGVKAVWRRIFDRLTGQSVDAPSGAWLFGAQGAVAALFFCVGLVTGLSDDFSEGPADLDLSESWAIAMTSNDSMEDDL